MSKIRSLQVFHRDGKLIGTLDEVEGQILLISNFTLYGENRKGNLIVSLQHEGIDVKTGIFGAYMEVDSMNG